MAFLFIFFMPDMDTNIKEHVQENLFVARVNYSPELAEIVELSDYAPMLVPTKLNSMYEIPAPEKPKGWNVEAPKYMFNNPNLSKKEILNYNESIADYDNWFFISTLRGGFSGYKRVDISGVETLKSKSFNFELFDLSTGEKILSDELQIPLRGEKLSRGVFYFAVEDDGWVGNVILKNSTGKEEIDSKLIALLNRKNLLKGVKSGSYKAIFTP